MGFDRGLVFEGAVCGELSAGPALAFVFNLRYCVLGSLINRRWWFEIFLGNMGVATVFEPFFLKATVI